MTDWSSTVKANKEFDMHSHVYPDGTYSTMHSHANGDISHRHMIKLIGGQWMIDYVSDPMLAVGAQVGHGQPVQAQVPPAFQPDPPMQMPSAKVAINQTNPNWPVGFKVHFEAGSLLPPGFVWEDNLVYGSPAPTTAPEPKKSRADLIWEAIQGASKA